MRTIVFTLALGLLGLQGCASMGGMGSQGDLEAIPLFSADSQPQFTAYLGCRGSMATVQCSTVDNVFYAWANARRIKLSVVDEDAPMPRDDKAPATSDNPGLAKPYRLVILVEPIVVPSYHTSGGVGGTMTSGYIPGKVGYNATISVFSTSSGSLVEKLSLHPRQGLPERANVTPAIKSEMHDLIAHIDPDYSS